jgi:hypothetical protein
MCLSACVFLWKSATYEGGMGGDVALRSRPAPADGSVADASHVTALPIERAQLEALLYQRDVCFTGRALAAVAGRTLLLHTHTHTHTKAQAFTHTHMHA